MNDKETPVQDSAAPNLGGLSYKGVTQRGFITHQNLEYTHEDHNR